MLKPENAVLVLVDIQGKLATLMHDRETLYKNLVILAKVARRLEIPILWNEQVPEKLGSTIHELVDVLDEDMVPLPKSSFSACGNPTFVKCFRELGRIHVLLAGIETHVCVYQTARDFLSAKVKVHVVADAVSSRTEDNKRYALERMRQEGATITTTEMILFELLQVAEGDVFRELSRLVR